jgi:integrase
MALEDNVIDTDPFVGGLRYPKVIPTNIVYLNKEDFESIIADLGRKIGSSIGALDMLDVMVAIGVLTGVRRGELVALRWGDFVNLDGCHFSNVQINISHSVSKVKGKAQKYGPTKTPASTRMFNIPELLARVLWAWKQELSRRGVPTDKHNSVICDQFGQMVSVYSPTKWFHKYLEEHALKDVRLHSLRHTFASLLFEQKMSLSKIMWVMGHTDIATTQIYLHLFELNSGRLMVNINSYTASLLEGLGGTHAS